MTRIRLDRFSNPDFDRGRNRAWEAGWRIVQAVIFSPLCPSYAVRRVGLRLFGAHVGRGVVLKDRISIKFPWRLSLGDHSWIGECVWIDNLADVRIGRHVCVSQGVYLCTGSHDWSRATFDLRTGSIIIEDGAWLAANVIVAPGTIVGIEAVAVMGAVVLNDVDNCAIVAGNPATAVRQRRIDSRPG